MGVRSEASAQRLHKWDVSEKLFASAFRFQIKGAQHAYTYTNCLKVGVSYANCHGKPTLGPSEHFYFETGPYRKQLTCQLQHQHVDRRFLSSLVLWMPTLPKLSFPRLYLSDLDLLLPLGSKICTHPCSGPELFRRIVGSFRAMFTYISGRPRPLDTPIHLHDTSFPNIGPCC